MVTGELYQVVMQMVVCGETTLPPTGNAGRSFSAIVSDFHEDDLNKNEQLVTVFAQSLLDGQLQQ